MIFNTTKKLAQLCKVTTFMLCNMAEMEYHKQILRDNFEREFQKIQDNHNSVISKILDDLNSRKAELSKTIAGLFNDRHKELSDKFTSFRASLVSQVETEQTKILTDLSQLNGILVNLTQSLNDLMDQLQEPLGDIYSNSTRGGLEELKQKHSADIKTHEAAAAQRLKDLDLETKARLAKLDRTYSKSVESLKRQFMASSKGGAALIAFLNNLRSTVSKLKAEIGAIRKEIVDSVKNMYIKKIHDEIRNYIRSYKEIQENGETRIAMLSNDIQSSTENLTGDYEKLCSEQREASEIMKSEKTKAENRLKTTIQNTEKDVSEKRTKLQSLVEANSAALNALNKEHIGLREEAEKRHKEARKSAMSLLSGLEAELTMKMANYRVQETSLADELNNLKIKFGEAFSKLQEELEDKMHLEYAEYESKRSMLYHKIGESKSLSSDLAASEKELQMLLEQLDSLKKEHGATVNEIKQSLDEQSMLLSEQYLSESSKIQSERECVITQMKDDREKQLERIRMEHEQKKQSLMAKVAQDSEQACNNCRREIENNGEIQQIIDQYTAELKTAKQKLNDLEIGSGKTSVDILNEEISGLRTKRDALIKLTESEKSALIGKFNKMIEEEASRHAATISTATDYDGMIDSLNSKCNDELALLNARIDDLTQKLRSLQSVSLEMKNTKFEDDRDVIALTTELERLRNELHAKRKAAQDRKDHDIQEAIHRNESKKIELETSESNLHNEMAVLEETNAESLKTAKERLASSAQLAAEALCAKENEKQERVQAEQNKMAEELESLQKKLSERKSNLDTSRSRCWQELADEKEKHDTVITNYNTQAQEELDTIKSSIDEQLKKLEVYLAEAQKARDIAKERSQGRPMREEERSQIMRLQNLCDMKTKQLTMIAKDLMGYKNRMKRQEENLNERFGVAPQIAILKAGSKRVTSTLANRKPLPPLPGG